MHFLRGTAVNETLTYLGDDTFGFRDTLVRFYREGGRVTGLRLDNVGTNVKLTSAAEISPYFAPGSSTAAFPRVRKSRSR